MGNYEKRQAFWTHRFWCGFAGAAVKLIKPDAVPERYLVGLFVELGADDETLDFLQAQRLTDTTPT